MSRHVTRMNIFQALHFSPEKRDEIIASYPRHVRRARAMGLPAIGEGAVFPIEDEAISCSPFDVPPHWMELGGLDFGYDHPTAAVRIAFNREAETYYVTQSYRKRQEVPLNHVQNLLGWGRHLPFAWGMEGLQVKLSENPEQTQKMFRKHGLRMVDAHATFANGGVGVERGVMEIYELMMAGRFKIFSNLADVFEEKNTYHRAKKNDDQVAQIVKVHDDLMDAMRYAYMMFRYSVPVSWRAKHGGRPNPANSQPRGIDSRDIFGGR